MDEVFRQGLTDGAGFTIVSGTCGDSDNLAGFFFNPDVSNYDLFNNSQPNFIWGNTCSIGNTSNPEKDNVLKNLLFHNETGVVGSFAPTINTTQHTTLVSFYNMLDLLVNKDIRIIGDIAYAFDVAYYETTNIPVGNRLRNKPFRANLKGYHANSMVLYGDPAMPLALHQYKNSDITANTTWLGSIVVEQDITIQSGDTLTIKPGTGIFFKPGATLKIYGHLEARGTDAFPIVFGRADSASHDNRFWNGIIVYSTGSFHLDHVQVNGARFGLYANYAAGTITASRFEEDYYGVYLYQSANTTLSGNTFVNNRYGTYSSYSSPTITDNQYTANVFGIIFNRSTGKLSGNTLSGSQYDGLYCTNLSSPDLSTTWPDDGTTPEVNNSITNNGRYGVYINTNSTPDLGTYFYSPGRYYAGGLNKFTPAPGGYDIKSEYDRTIYAELNWWDDLRVLGNVDTDPTADQVFRGAAKILVSADGGVDSLAALLLAADSLVLDSAFSAAVSLILAVVAGAPDDPLAETAVTRLVRLFTRLDDLSSLGDHLGLIQAQYSDQLAGVCAADYLVTLASRTQDYEAALLWSEKVIGAYQARNTGEAVAWALYEQGLIYESVSVTGGDLGRVLSPDELQARAEAAYRRLLEDYPATAAAYFLREFRGEASPPPETVASLPTAYRLYPAYPNPFNPRTTIAYDLPEADRVTLGVYDLLGREVAVLVRGYRPAGGHQAIWSGRDDRGRPVSSGVYLIRLITPRYTATGKVLLLR
jgi:parallel beta-helix repeat protein